MPKGRRQWRLSNPLAFRNLAPGGNSDFCRDQQRACLRWGMEPMLGHLSLDANGSTFKMKINGKAQLVELQEGAICTCITTRSPAPGSRGLGCSTC
jgi:hypothetical protein